MYQQKQTKNRVWNRSSQPIFLKDQAGKYTLQSDQPITQSRVKNFPVYSFYVATIGTVNFYSLAGVEEHKIVIRKHYLLYKVHKMSLTLVELVILDFSQ